jgi:hypothetical protein
VPQAQCSTYAGVILHAAHIEQTLFWGWDETQWQRILSRTDGTFRAAHCAGPDRRLLLAAVYLLGVVRDPEPFGVFELLAFAKRVLGSSALHAAFERVDKLSWTDVGSRRPGRRGSRPRPPVADRLLVARRAHLEARCSGPSAAGAPAANRRAASGDRTGARISGLTTLRRAIRLGLPYPDEPHSRPVRS